MTSRFTAGLRILAIDPITKGLGFAVLEERRGLIHWGVRNAASGAESRRLFRHLLDRYAPDVLVLGDYRAWDARRPARVRRLLESLERLLGGGGNAVGGGDQAGGGGGAGAAVPGAPRRPPAGAEALDERGLQDGDLRCGRAGRGLLLRRAGRGVSRLSRNVGWRQGPR